MGILQMQQDVMQEQDLNLAAMEQSVASTRVRPSLTAHTLVVMPAHHCPVPLLRRLILCAITPKKWITPDNIRKRSRSMLAKDW